MARITLPIRENKYVGALVMGALFISALLPRLCAINRYITPDELTWVYRSVQFREALLDGRWSETIIAGHPGVTITWLGTLGISAQLAISPADRAIYEWLTHLAWISPDLIPAFPRLASFLTAGRLAVAILTSLGVVAIYALARPRIGRRAAILAGFFLALDPFTAGLSGLLHVDGLTATLITLSLLALANGIEEMNSRKAYRYVAAAGAFAALAALTKSPALLLGPFSGLVLFLGLFRKPAGSDSWGIRFRLLLGHGGIWLAAFLALALLVLPALWAAPNQVLDTIVSAANRHAGDALRATFFMGQVELDHGPLFYPVALAFRLGPLISLGLVLALFFLIRGDKLLRSHSILVLLFWVPLFIAIITPVAKKFDRYALPVIPPLILIAAAAWSKIADRRPQLASFPIVIQVIVLALIVPYPLAAFNPFLGGARTAEKVLTVGWGEGISTAARWLAAQPGAADMTAIASNPLALAPFFPGQTLPFDDEGISQANYMIMDVNNRQLDPAGFDRLTADLQLLHTVHLGNLDYAWVYRQPSPERPRTPIPDLASAYSFGNRVLLLGAMGQATSERVQLSVRWGLSQAGGRYSVHLVLRDAWGHIWGNLETPLLNNVHFYPEHWETGERPESTYTIKLPVGIPPAKYALELSLFDQTGARLPLLDSKGAFHGVIYVQEKISIPLPAEPPSLAGLYVPIPTDASWFDGSLTLLGHTTLPDTLLAGDGAHLEFFWQPHAPLPAGLLLNLALNDEVQTNMPLSRTPSDQWQVGGLIHEQMTLPIPPELPAGRYPLSITPTTAGGTPLDGPTVILGTVEIISPDRQFHLPQDIPTPLDYQLGDSIWLRGLALATLQAAPGDEVHLTLYWQTEAQPDGLYTAFVHLIGPDGAIIAQADRWPGNSPSHTWAAGQVIVDEYAILLPDSAPAGQVQIATGLYDAANGQPLTLLDANGMIVPDNRLILPVALSVGEGNE